MKIDGGVSQAQIMVYASTIKSWMQSYTQLAKICKPENCRKN
jgi:hypothetical protein